MPPSSSWAGAQSTWAAGHEEQPLLEVTLSRPDTERRSGTQGGPEKGQTRQGTAGGAKTQPPDPQVQACRTQAGTQAWMQTSAGAACPASDTHLLHQPSPCPGGATPIREEETDCSTGRNNLPHFHRSPWTVGIRASHGCLSPRGAVSWSWAESGQSAWRGFGVPAQANGCVP